jgi:hypothetical protein
VNCQRTKEVSFREEVPLFSVQQASLRGVFHVFWSNDRNMCNCQPLPTTTRASRLRCTLPCLPSTFSQPPQCGPEGDNGTGAATNGCLLLLQSSPISSTNTVAPLPRCASPCLSSTLSQPPQCGPEGVNGLGAAPSECTPLRHCPSNISADNHQPNTTLAHRCARTCLVSTFSHTPKCVPEEGNGPDAALCLPPPLWPPSTPASPWQLSCGVRLTHVSSFFFPASLSSVSVLCIISLCLLCQ